MFQVLDLQTKVLHLNDSASGLQNYLPFLLLFLQMHVEAIIRCTVHDESLYKYKGNVWRCFGVAYLKFVNYYSQW